MLTNLAQPRRHRTAGLHLAMIMHDICIVMHMTAFSVAVAGASGYAGGEVLRLLLGHPGLEIGTLTGASNAGERSAPCSRTWCRSPTGSLRADRPAETLAGHDVVVLALPHGQSGPLAAQLGERHRRDRLRCRLPARGRRPRGSGSTAASTPGPGPTGCPSCPASAQLLRGATPGRRARLLPDGLHPRPGPGARAPAWSSPTSWWSPPAAPPAPGKAAKTAPARQRGDGQRLGVRRRRRPPAHPRDRAEPRRASPASRSRVSFTPLLVPMPRGILATCSAPLSGGVTAEQAYDAYATAYADEPFVHVLPPGQWPQTKAVAGSNAVHLQVTVDEAAGRLVAVGAVDNLDQGHRRCRRPVPQPRARPRPRPPASRRSGWRRDEPTYTLSRYPETLAVVRLRPRRRAARVGGVVLAVLSITATATETSVVCAGAQRPDQDPAPEAVHRVRGRRARSTSR